MYFMIGLPRETFAEVQGIVDLGYRAREIGRRQLGHGGRFTVHVSASNFVPKPHTPFQWEGMSSPDQLRVKQEYLRRAITGRQLRLSLHDTGTSMLEGALGRGDAVTGDVIETAWRAGARFDAWTEHHQPAVWREAFATHGRSTSSEATRERDALEPLPWDHVKSGVTKEFLLDEWWASRAERARATAAGTGARIAGPAWAPCGTGWCRDRTPRRKSACLKLELRFAVTGRARFLSHLECVDGLLAAFRRAGFQVALSHGMRPKPVISLAMARAVGVASLDELMTVELVGEHDPDEVRTRLAATLPRGLEVLAAGPFTGTPRPVSARYRVELDAPLAVVERELRAMRRRRRRPSSAPRRSV